MKKIYFTLLSIFCGISFSNAQTVTSTNHAPVIGDSYSRIQVDSTGIAALAAITGSTAVWNFTTPNTRTLSVANTYTTRTSVATGSMYPTSSIAKLNGPEKAFYVLSSSDMKFWGGNVVILGNNADFVFSSGVTQATYPMTYADFTNSSAFTGTIISGFGNGTISGGTGNVTYDGLGTLNLASRSFSNVIRLKTTTSFAFNLLVTGNITFQNYDYYDLSKSKHPLLTVSASTISSTAGTSIQYYAYLNKDYQVIGVNELTSEVSDLNLYPNPAKSKFNISLTNAKAEDVSYEIMNALGQTVKKETLSTDKGEVKYAIDIDNIPSGVYFVKVNVGNATSTKKITIQ